MQESIAQCLFRVGSDTRGETCSCPLRGHPCRKVYAVSRSCTPKCHCPGSTQITILSCQECRDFRLQKLCAAILVQDRLDFVMFYILDMLYSSYRSAIPPVKSRALSWMLAHSGVPRTCNSTLTTHKCRQRATTVSKCESQKMLAKLGLPLRGEHT